METYLAAAFGQEGLRQLSGALCRPPRSTCLRLNTLHHTIEVLNAFAHCLHTAGVVQPRQQSLTMCASTDQPIQGLLHKGLVQPALFPNHLDCHMVPT